MPLAAARPEPDGSLKPTRACGTCTACCVTMGIPELKNPAMVPCQFIKDGCSCAIYAQKPDSCSVWSCVWALGFVPEEFDPQSTGLTLTIPDNVEHTVLMAKRHPATPDLWRTRPDLIGFLKGMSYKMPVLIGMYQTDVVFHEGDERVFTAEERKALAAGRSVMITPTFEFREAGAPQWLTD